MSRYLLRGGCVLTMGRTNHTSADVLVDGDTIAEIAPSIRARDAEVIDAGDAIVMPGFVDAHRHLSQSLTRNAGVAPVATRLLEPDDLYAATLVGLLGAVQAGITTVVDWCSAASSAEHGDAALQAHADAGIRTVFIPVAASEAELRRTPASPLTSIAVGARDGDDADAAAPDWELARALGLRLHAHVARTPAGRGTAAAWHSRGRLDPNVTLVHCTHADQADLEAIAASRAEIVLTPSSEMASGQGTPPVQRLLDHGLRPGLGIDVEHSAPGDLFAQMRSTISVQHATMFDLKLAGKAGLPRLLTTRDVIRYATADGARAAGLGDRVGVLEPGMQADLLVLRTDRPNIHPINDPIGAVVWGMDTSNIDWVFVAGRPRVASGTLDADVARIRALAVSARDRVAAAGAGR